MVRWAFRHALWLVAALFAAAMAFVPVTASAHPGNHDFQVKVLAGPGELAAASAHALQQVRPFDLPLSAAGSSVESKSSAESREAACPELKASCGAASACFSCLGTCCCSAGCSFAVCPSVTGYAMPLIGNEAEFFPAAPDRLNSLSPQSPLEPPNATA